MISKRFHTFSIPYFAYFYNRAAADKSMPLISFAEAFRWALMYFSVKMNKT